MKIGLLGDIHGNYLALKSVLDSACKLKVEKLLITGDLIGYYFYPLKVIELLDKWDKSIVQGNHEQMLSIARNNNSYLNEIDSIYGSGIRIAIDQLSSCQLDELSHLPHPLKLNIEGVEILLCHGSPWDLNEYIYPDLSSKTIQKLLLYPYNLIITGHTHYPMLKKFDGINIVNPGSVGQPRNGQKGAQWALFDTADGSINFFLEKYDSTGLAIECKLRHPEIPYLSDVLNR